MPTPPAGSSSMAAGDRDSESEWVSRQVEAMAAAWGRGDRLSAEAILARRPDLGIEAAIRLVYEEVCLRRESGQEVPTTEVVRRFPRWKNELKVLFGCDRLLRPAAVLPEVGDFLGPFRLRAELGRGASGRTYLATEPMLADRSVVLKVRSDDQYEHLSLARLQHTHIVPLFSEHAFPDRGLRALCMPYLGGASLDRILQMLADIPPDQRLGRHLLEVDDQTQGENAAPPLSDGPYRRFLEQASYVEAVCWVVACLADALHYAHARGLVHWDVKPSNVLITADGQPMLLDFHLARGPIGPGESVADRIGGTPGWMAPEQREALEAVSRGRPVAQGVDGRCDLYALGLLLYEMLGGPGVAAEVTAGRFWHGCPPGTSTGLTDLIRKCLAPVPTDRYPSAAALADDLRRHLNDLPLRGVANRSLVERWNKWRRRRPGVLARGAAWAAALAAALVAATLAGAVYRQRVHEIETALEDGRTLRAERRYPEAARALRRGLERAEGIPAVGRLTHSLTAQLRLAQRGQKAADLNALADLIRFRHGLTPPAGEEARALLRHCRAVWDERDSLIRRGDGALDLETERRIRTDLLELAVVWADLRVRLASPEDAERAKRDALRVLDEAKGLFGTSPALDREHRAYAQALGFAVTAAAPDSAPRSAWEHYDLGRSYLRSGQIAEAAQEFQSTLDWRPQDFWSNFYQGHCAYRLGRFEEAVAAFRTCIALAPDVAECHYNRALASDALGRIEHAFRDYTRALELDPGLAAAALNRGILSYKAGRHLDAVNDFQSALRAASDPDAIGRIHYNLALAYLALGDQPAALASAVKAMDRGCREAQVLCKRLQPRS